MVCETKSFTRRHQIGDISVRLKLHQKVTKKNTWCNAKDNIFLFVNDIKPF